MRYIQCCLCPSIIDTYRQNCGYELYSKEVNIPGFKSKLRNDRAWFHLDCYYNLRLRKWGNEDPPRINGEPCIVRSESKLLPISPKPERLPRRWEHVTTPSVKISEILEADSITIVNRPLEVKDADSVSMSRYFEDVTMKEVEQVSDKAVYAIRRRFASMVQNQKIDQEKTQNKSETETPTVKENPNVNNGKVYIGDDDVEDEGVTRNVKIIEGLDSKGKIILREVGPGEE